jgi:hypothetical protein
VEEILKPYKDRNTDLEKIIANLNNEKNEWKITEESYRMNVSTIKGKN